MMKDTVARRNRKVAINLHKKTKKHITSIEGGLCTDDGKLFLKLLRARNNTTPYKNIGVRRNC